MYSFQGVTQPSLWKFQDVGCMRSTPWNGNYGGGGGAEARVLSVGGMDIIWNYIFAHWSLLISRSTLSCELGNK